MLTPDAAQTQQDECDRDRELLSWVVMEAKDSAAVIARPITSGRGALPCVLVAATLAKLHGMMPAGLTRSLRQPAAPPAWWRSSTRLAHRVLSRWTLEAGARRAAREERRE